MVVVHGMINLRRSGNIFITVYVSVRGPMACKQDRGTHLVTSWGCSILYDPILPSTLFIFYTNTPLVSFQSFCRSWRCQQKIMYLIYLHSHSQQIPASSTSSPPHSTCLASKVHALACSWNTMRGLFQLILFICCFSLCSTSTTWWCNSPIWIGVFWLLLISLITSSIPYILLINFTVLVFNELDFTWL